jgi:hypothetical protein
VRAQIPSNQRFFYADPNLLSLHPTANGMPSELAALRSGLIAEKKVTLQPSTTTEQFRVAAQQAQLDFQAEIDASNVLGMSGLYGVNSRFVNGVWA